jgi:hypothetical protein
VDLVRGLSVPVHRGNLAGEHVAQLRLRQHGYGCHGAASRIDSRSYLAGLVDERKEPRVVEPIRAAYGPAVAAPAATGIAPMVPATSIPLSTARRLVASGKPGAFVPAGVLSIVFSLHCASVTATVTRAQYQVSNMVTSAQLRAARALLDWTVRELAEQADVHRNTITRAETDATAHGHAIAQVVLTLEAAGVEFTNGDQPGVRLKKS